MCFRTDGGLKRRPDSRGLALLFADGEMHMTYPSAAKVARLWGISARSVRNCCAQGRVPGAFLTGEARGVPADAGRPVA